MKHTRKATVAVSLVLSAGTWFGGTVLAADQPQGPQVSKPLAKPLKAAQDAMAQKKWDEALSHLKEAEAAAADKTPYDHFVLDVFSVQIYGGKNDMASVIPAIEDASQSQYATPEQARTWLKNAALYHFQQKEYPKAIDDAQEAIKHGLNDADTQTLIAKSQYLTGKYKDAATTMQDVVSKQEKPDEESLKLLWQFDLKAGDEAAAGKAVEKLVMFYPKPEYWANALASLVRLDTQDGRLQLNIYRLMNDVGVLKLPTDYGEMAGLALDQGYPGETVSVLQKAMSQNVFTEQRDKERYQHLLDGAKGKAQKDQAHLAEEETQANAAATGDQLVEVGAAYMTYGQNDKGLQLIQQGIAKGNLKSAEDDYLLLGIAQLRNHNNAEASKAFEKVGNSSNMGYARLGKLWALRAGAHNA